MTTDTLLTKAATLRKQFSALITDCVFKARTPAETQRSEPTYPAAFDELMLACFKAGQLREREDAGKAEGLDAARWRKFVSLDTLDARDAVERWGTEGLAPIIDKVIVFDENCLATKPGDGESRG